MQYKELYDASLTFGTDFSITSSIKIHMPTVREIIAYGEQKFYNIIYAFTSTSSNYKSQLDDEGIDWQVVSDYELFQRLFIGVQNEDLSILFGNLDLNNFRLAIDNNTHEIVFLNDKTGIVIDRLVYECISDYICSAYHIEKIHEKAANNSTRLLMIEEARDNLLAERDKPYEPYLHGMVCAMANTTEFKGNYFEALDYPICIFMDCVKQVQKIKNFNNMMQGAYAGTVDLKKVPKSQLNWLKKAE